MTANHCLFSSVTPDQLMVRLGDYMINMDDDDSTIDAGEVLVMVQDFTRHPSLDAAIIILECQPKLGPDINVITLSDMPSSDILEIQIAGWGTNEETSVADTMQKITLNTTEMSTCNSMNMGADFTLQEHHFCAGMSTGDNMNICRGDSGGGAIYRSMTGRPYLVGMVERGAVACADTEPYAVFIEVTHDDIYHWIIDITDPSVPLCERDGPTVPPAPSNLDPESIFISADPDECFPSNATVQLEATNSEVPISTLRKGDRVLAMTASGDAVYSEFLGYLHQHSSIPSQFFTIRTSSNTLQISSKHLLYVFQSQDDKHGTYDFAKNIRVGKYVLTVNDAGNLVRSRVTAISRADAVGFYAPLTSEGTIIVDGVVASCYATVPYHSVAHLGTWPYRMWQKYISGEDHVSESVEVMPAYIQMLQQFVLPAILSVAGSR